MCIRVKKFSIESYQLASLKVYIWIIQYLHKYYKLKTRAYIYLQI